MRGGAIMAKTAKKAASGRGTKKATSSPATPKSSPRSSPTPALLSVSAYGRHRKAQGLTGGTRQGVQKAIDRGALRESLHPADSGRILIDPILADREWAENTTPQKQRAPKGADPRHSGPGVQAELFEGATEPIPAGETPVGPTVAQSSQESARLRAQLLRLELLERQGELVERAKVESEAFALARDLRERILQVPARLARKLVGIESEHDVREMLFDELHRSLASLADG